MSFGGPRRTFASMVVLSLSWPIGFGQCRFPAAGKGQPIRYVFEPAVRPAATVLHITLEFRGSAAGIEQIEEPAHWAGETLHGVTNLRAVSPRTIISDSSEPDKKIVRFPSNAKVVLTYDLVKDWSGRFRSPLQFHPVLMPNYLEMNGENWLVYPKMDDDTVVTTQFAWRNLPRTWILATSFGTSSENENYCQSYSGPWKTVLEALFTAGEFRIHHFAIRNRPAVLAIRDRWTFTDDEAMVAIEKAVGAVRAFWGDDNFPYFLVTLKAYDNDTGDGDGSAFTNAFWLYMSRQDSISRYLPILAHEAFHEWNPRRMGALSPEDDGQIQWFKEGFTTYYGDLLLYRVGALRLSEYVDRIDGDFRLFPNSKDAYVRGRIIALWANAEIRKKSAGKNSLDNVMFDLVHENNRALTQDRILNTLARYMQANGRATLDAAIHGGVLPAPADDVLGRCATMSLDELPTFDLGFDLPASMRAGKVTGVAEGGPAFAAGLRDGQKVTHWSVYRHDPDKMATFKIQTETGERIIQYYPRGKKGRVPQFRLTQAAESVSGSGCAFR